MVTKTEARHEKTKERVSKQTNRSKAWRSGEGVEQLILDNMKKLLNKDQIREEIYTDIIQEYCDLSQDQISNIVDNEMKKHGLGINIKLSLTAVALDTLEEELQDLRNGFGDDLDVEVYNLDRIIAIKNIRKILKDYE